MGIVDIDTQFSIVYHYISSYIGIVYYISIVGILLYKYSHSIHNVTTV